MPRKQPKTTGSDLLTGDDFRNIIIGFDGDDTILGLGGDDILIGGRGDDEIDAGDGDDIAFGGFGNDLIRLGIGNDRAFGGFGNDTIETGSGNDRVFGGHGTDRVVVEGGFDAYDLSFRGNPSKLIVLNLLDESGAAVETKRLHRVEEIAFDDVTLLLDGRNNAAFARDDTAATDEDSALTLNAADLLANDTDFDGDALSVTAVDALSAAGAAVTLSGGQITYDPAGRFDALATGETATDSFDYTVDDGRGGISTATVTVTITGVNDAPVLSGPETADFAENGTGDVALFSATDADDGTLTFALSGDDAALFTIDAAGALRFVAAPDFETPLDADGDNAYDLTVTVSDDEGAEDSAALRVTVTDILELPDVDARINELHYDNEGTDAGEFVEVRVRAGDDVSLLSVELVNGSGGAVYNTLAVSGGVMTSDGSWDYYVLSLPSNGLQNGAPDGVVLANGPEVIEFLSYEGSFAATSGTATGLTSTDILVAEAGDTPHGFSLQRLDGDIWDAPRENTAGADNTPAPEPLVARINEFHYDNAGTDAGEFIEIRVNAGGDASGLSVELVNGSNGTVYGTLAIADATMTSDGTWDYYVFDLPSNGLQNGSPDGIVLANGGAVVEFLSYEGAFTATSGAANGLTSTDIGVTEPSDTPLGFSLQRAEDGSWYEAGENTSGAENQAPPMPFEARINEFHYDNEGADQGEFIELRVTAGADASGLAVEFYNGSNGAVYGTLGIADATMTSDGTWDYYVFNLPSNGLQNGAPDGIALSNAGTLIEFLSYEGPMTAVGGAADGVTATDIGVAEAGDTPVGFSLQRLEGDTWDAPRQNTSGADNAGGTPPGPTTTVISTIQGSGAASALVGQTVTVTAIVVGDFQNGDGDDMRNLNGFFLQEEAADHDADAATSEGLFVFDGGVGVNVALGDRVTVTGTVSEFFGMTQISATTVTVVEAGAVADVNTMATIVDLDAATAISDGAGGYVADLEAFEGMLITIPETLTISEAFNFDRFGEIRLSANGQPSQFTQDNDPDAAGYDAHLREVFSDSIVYDDGRSIQNPAQVIPEADMNGDGVFNTADPFGMGDTITNATGVMEWRFSEYRMHSVSDGTNSFVDTRTRDATPPSLDEPGGRSAEVVVASFNVLNFFTTIDDGFNTSGPTGLEPRGADTPEEYTRQFEKLITALTAMDADIFGLVELENEFQSDQNGDGTFAIEAIVDGLNASYGADLWAYVDPGRTFVDVSDAISVGMIYRTDVVSVSGPAQILDDSVLASLPGSYGTDALFDGDSTNRAPLAANFVYDYTDLSGAPASETFTVAVTHMKSKGGAGLGGDADAGDGAGAYNETRTEGVQALTDWLDPTRAGAFADADQIVLGDFNAYAMEDPIDAMKADGYADLEGTFNPGASTYVFDGQTGTLDYAFASAAILDRVTNASAWNINSPEPDIFDYDTSFRPPEQIDVFDGTVPWRSSDHDPMLVGLNFSGDALLT
ncbi:ExeM/NucH family extracellular endonuclease [Thetidibacter halocola]|uniref:ExeM/NucH family extracellular endonuclease n=1 Tax=Thetidibacter halocola TaxID=2827239 RepID=A0A8J7WDB8_9RHOB|nr:ExeM/NucH family extracellular endonuclease [Thetidibacter halocola]MBS0123251.1 ExeM/NucH family extracellular endonuclease [Thetidibacter halocola]